jgi:hypothetical protein
MLWQHTWHLGGQSGIHRMDNRRYWDSFVLFGRLAL